MQQQDTTLRPGTLLQGGRYRIIRFISAGGFGCTYEAEHLLLQSRVAVKELYMRDICNRDGYTGAVSVGAVSQVRTFNKYRAKFLDEARAVFRLSHPGIVHVSDVFEENGTAYFVMDYIEGGSLGEMIKKHGPMDERTALGYMQQVCSALDYVHGQGRLHLDIKPGNIMVDRHGRAILIDFGVSKQYDGATGDNTSTLLGCTPGFAPPEQMKGNVKKFLPATDVYALGATLYKLLTGNDPIDATDRISGESNPPLPPAVSATTRRAVEAALLLNKTERPQSVAKFAAMLFGGAAPQPAPGPRPQPGPRPAPKPTDDTKPLDGPASGSTQPWYKRYGVAIALVAVVVIGGLIAKFAGGGKVDVVDPTDTVEAEEVAVWGDSALPDIDAAAFAQAAQAPAEPAREQAQAQAERPATPAAASEPARAQQAQPPTDALAAATEPRPRPELTARSRQEAPAQAVAPAATSRTGTHNGHEWVDLGLSVKWATTNLGATSPSGYGNYYAWGETSTKSTYTTDNSLTYGDSSLGDIAGDPTYDAARYNWKGKWRVPTIAELTELKDRCTWTWTTQDGHNGYRVTGLNGQSIFLPAAGFRDGTSLRDAGLFGRYWSSLHSLEDFARTLDFYTGERSVYYGYYRYWGCSVRPVLE